MGHENRYVYAINIFFCSPEFFLFPNRLLEQNLFELLCMNINTSHFRIAIVGAGPTGIFTALLLGTALQNEGINGSIDLIEKQSSIGEKLRRTGGGRMNVTNKVLTSDQFFSSEERRKNHFFRHPSFKNLPHLFSQLGVEYQWENNRAILASQSAPAEVERLFLKLREYVNIQILLDTEISSVHKKDDIFLVKGVQKKEEKNIVQQYDIVVLCTGGMFQIQEQPNKKKAYHLFESTGHNLVSPSPSLSPFRLSPYNPFASLSGVSFHGKIFSSTVSTIDDILLTHFGISGPAVLDFSAQWNGTEDLFLSFLPKMSTEKVEQYIREYRNGKTSPLRLFPFLPKRIIRFLLESSHISKKYLSDWSRKEISEFAKLCTHFPFPKPQLFPYPGCWTTKGGVSLNDVYTHSLESKKMTRLYIGGEVLDIDGLCGGYHISFSVLCADIIAKSIVQELLYEQ